MCGAVQTRLPAIRCCLDLDGCVYPVRISHLRKQITDACQHVVANS